MTLCHPELARLAVIDNPRVHHAIGQAAERDAAAVWPGADAEHEAGEPPGQDRLAGLAGMDAEMCPGSSFSRCACGRSGTTIG